MRYWSVDYIHFGSFVWIEMLRKLEIDVWHSTFFLQNVLGLNSMFLKREFFCFDNLVFLRGCLHEVSFHSKWIWFYNAIASKLQYQSFKLLKWVLFWFSRDRNKIYFGNLKLWGNAIFILGWNEITYGSIICSCLVHFSAQECKNPLRENFIYSGKRKLFLHFKKLKTWENLYFLKRKLFLYLEEMETNLKKFLIFSQKRAFLIFRGNGNKNPEKISYIFSKKKSFIFRGNGNLEKSIYTSGNRNPSKTFYILGNGTFLP